MSNNEVGVCTCERGSRYKNYEVRFHNSLCPIHKDEGHMEPGRLEMAVVTLALALIIIAVVIWAVICELFWWILAAAGLVGALVLALYGLQAVGLK